LTALLFALATLVRHTLGSYLGAVLVFAGLLVSDGLVGGTLGRWDLAKLLDSTGHTALQLMSRTWSPVESNERLVGLGGGLFWNRLLWLGVAFAALGFTRWRFRFGANVGGVRWWRRGRRAAGDGRSHLAGGGRRELDGSSVARRAPVAVPRVTGGSGATVRVRQMLSMTRDSLREMVTGWSWLVVPFL